MDNHSIYLALAEKELEDCMRPEMKAEWEQRQSKVSTDCFTADAVEISFLQLCCDKITKHDKR